MRLGSVKGAVHTQVKLLPVRFIRRGLSLTLLGTQPRASTEMLPTDTPSSGTGDAAWRTRSYHREPRPDSDPKPNPGPNPALDRGSR